MTAFRQFRYCFRRFLSSFRRKSKVASMPELPMFEFRLRFNMLKGDHIKSDKEELELLRTAGGQRIRLRAGSRGSPIEKSSQIAITGGPYSSQDEALGVAQAAREAVIVWAVKQ